MTANIISKKCPKCKKTVPIAQYRKTQRMCVVCSNKYYETYRKNNRDCLNQKRRDYFDKKAAKQGKTRIRKSLKIEQCYINKRRSLYISAKRRNLPFNLSAQEVKEILQSASKLCPYCQQIILKSSIDRKDNDIGYVKHNCIVVCMNCNILKSNTNKIQIKNIYLHLFGNVKPSEIK